jgi:hypothetical protein
VPSARAAPRCANCARGHEGTVYVGKTKCEDCFVKRPNFGILPDKKRRWCGPCAKAHPGSSDVSSKKCEDCGLVACKVRGLRARKVLGCL